MFLNYLKVTWRNIVRHKGHSFINIAGLAIGLACCLLITLWILDELSYDKFHADVDRIFNIRAQEGGESVPNVLAPALAEFVPEVEHATRLDWFGEALVSAGSETSYEGIHAVDPSFFDVFSFPFVQGNPATALTEVNSTVITKEIADRFFPGQSAVGQVLTLDRRHDYRITGVVEEVPRNSSIRFAMLVPIENEVRKFAEIGENWASWGWWSAETYVRVHPGCTGGQLDGKMRGFLKEHAEDGEDTKLWTVPLTALHLYDSNLKTYIYSFTAIAVIILVMAISNFVNLSVARSASRAKETGIRKVSGVRRGNLIRQFLAESVFLSFTSLLLAIGILELSLPLFNSMIGGDFSVGLLFDGYGILSLVGLGLVTGFFAGAYPAFYLSAFRPVSVLKGNVASGGRFRLRKVLIVFQFAASVFLMVAVFVVYSQLDYLTSKDVGYNKEQVVTVPLRGDTGRQFDALKNTLLQNSGIQAVTGSAESLPYWRWKTTTVDWPGKDSALNVKVAMNMVGYDFAETYGIEITEGRDFSSDYASDSISSYVVNEAMVKLMGLTTGEGANLTIWGNPGKVVGVMKDFNFRPLSSRIQPLAFVLNTARIYNMAVRIDPDDVPVTLGTIKETWERLVPGYPFDYSFVADNFDRSYRGVETMGDLAGSFSGLAIFIACLGLFGLASCAAEQRTKEIGIRKILGASVSGTVRLLSREFLLLVMVANIVAWPVSRLIMNKWLEDFAYHIDHDWSPYVLAGFLALILAVTTVGVIAIRAARANPVEALRYE